MIYLNLKGGLGNMMFQIAATKSISLEKKTDYSFPNLHNHIDYLRDEKTYNPNVNYCSEYLELPFLKNVNTSHSFLNIGFITYPFHFEEISLPTSNIKIDGFFQSEKYFKKHKKEILELFLPNEKIKQYIKEKYSKYFSERITSIHVRRGDYIKNNTHHFVQKMDYFTQSIEILNPKTDKYLIFSDDIEWCKENFKGENFIFIENEKDYIEIYLMSMCSNNITSNSSFSWWGAWLNENKNKTIISPKNWFGPSLQFLKTDDIIPNDWIKL